jgi:galactokinase/mevalonate kinase-like predicted kinase
VELNQLRVLCGFQDATMAVFGGVRFIDVRNRESLRQGPDEPYVTAEPLRLPSFPFVLAHTGVKHHSGTVHRSLRDRWVDGEEAVVRGYARIQRIAQMGKRALLDEDWETVAALMNENHAIQRDLGGSGEANERLIEAALAAGAPAAKLAGAGGGGTIIALTHDPEAVGKALLDAGADTLVDLDPRAKGVTIETTEERL